ncbi:protein transport protein S31, partial [Dispira parvispora]
GQTTIAAKYLKRTPDDYIRTRDDGENLLAILKDRLYHSGTLSGESMLVPSFPFEFVYVGGDGELQNQDYGLDAAAQQAPAPPAPGYPPVPADAGYPAMGYPRTSAVTTAAAPAPTSYQQAGYSGYGYSDYNATAYPSQANTVYPPPAAPYAGYGEAYSTAAAPPTPNTAYPYGQQVEPSVAPVPNPIQNAQATAPNVPPPSQQRSVPAYHDPPTTALNRKRNPSATKTGNNPIMAPFPSAAPIQNVQHTPAGPPPPTSQSRLTSPPPPPPPTGARPPQRAYRTSISKPTVPSPTRTAPPPTAPYQQHAPPPTAAYPPPSGHARPPPQGAHPHYPTGGHPVRPTPPSSSQMPAHPTPSTHAPYQRPPPGHAVRPGGGAPPMGYPSAHPPRPVGPSQQPPNAPRPPMSYGRPPTAGGVPSRAGTPQNVPVPRGPSAASSRPGTPAAAPGKYPPGDRSHIPEKQNPIFTSLQAGLQQARAATGPAQKRMMDDTEKRLNQLFDLMNNGDLPAKLEEPLLSLARAIQNGDYQQAHQVYLKLIHSNFDSSQRWMMGVKRLVETLKSIA